jgi:hypothetical protein
MVAVTVAAELLNVPLIRLKVPATVIFWEAVVIIDMFRAVPETPSASVLPLPILIHVAAEPMLTLSVLPVVAASSVTFTLLEIVIDRIVWVGIELTEMVV